MTDGRLKQVYTVWSISDRSGRWLEIGWAPFAWTPEATTVEQWDVLQTIPVESKTVNGLFWSCLLGAGLASAGARSPTKRARRTQPFEADMTHPAILPTPWALGHHVVVEWAQAATIVSALAAFTGLQALWISRALERIYAALDRVDSRLDHLDREVVRDHGERITRLEAAQSP